jgi:hypothetical protein
MYIDHVSFRHFSRSSRPFSALFSSLSILFSVNLYAAFNLNYILLINVYCHLSFRHFLRLQSFFRPFSVAFILFPSIFTSHLDLALHSSNKYILTSFFPSLLPFSPFFPPFFPSHSIPYFRQFLRHI